MPVMSKEYMRNWNLKKSYGVTFEQKAQILAVQEYKCAICGSSLPDAGERNACLDHDHKTKKVRAILCRACNCMLGYARDNPDNLIMAAAYLEMSHAR